MYGVDLEDRIIRDRDFRHRSRRPSGARVSILWGRPVGESGGGGRGDVSGTRVECMSAVGQ